MIRLLIAILLSSVSTLAQDEQENHPSVVQIARQTRAQRALNSDPPVIITNENLKSIQGAVSRTISSTTPAVHAYPEKESDTEAWSSRFEQAKGDLEAKLAQGLYLEEKMTALSNGWVPIIDGGIEGTLEEQLQQTHRALQDNQAETEAARSRLEELQRQARRDGVPAGTIRELMAMTSGR